MNDDKWQELDDELASMEESWVPVSVALSYLCKARTLHLAQVAELARLVGRRTAGRDLTLEKYRWLDRKHWDLTKAYAELDGKWKAARAEVTQLCQVCAWAEGDYWDAPEEVLQRLRKRYHEAIKQARAMMRPVSNGEVEEHVYDRIRRDSHQPEAPGIVVGDAETKRA